jgi:hypothetical protein
MNEAALRVCARLVREGAVARSELIELELPDVRVEVENRLAHVGLELATSIYSEFVGVRQSREGGAVIEGDAATNVGLRADACALLVILWSRLVLQKRTASDQRELPGQAALFSKDSADAARRFVPQVHVETIHREFGHVFGARSSLLKLVTQLRRLKFVAGRGEVLEAGPFLELGMDGERLVEFIRRGVLARLLENTAQGPPVVVEPEERVAETLRSLGGSAEMAELRAALGQPSDAIRKHLRALEDQRRVTHTGDRNKTRYHLAQPIEREESATPTRTQVHAEHESVSAEDEE